MPYCFGKCRVAGAGSTQYVVDHFRPVRLINLGTCGGVEGRINRFDIAEATGDSKEAIAHYSTALPLPPRLPVPVVKVIRKGEIRTASGRPIPTRLPGHPIRYRRIIGELEG